jgi:hypothetical protein
MGSIELHTCYSKAEWPHQDAGAHIHQTPCPPEQTYSSELEKKEPTTARK